MWRDGEWRAIFTQICNTLISLKQTVQVEKILEHICRVCIYLRVTYYISRIFQSLFDFLGRFKWRAECSFRGTMWSQIKFTLIAIAVKIQPFKMLKRKVQGIYEYIYFFSDEGKDQNLKLNIGFRIVLNKKGNIGIVSINDRAPYNPST